MGCAALPSITIPDNIERIEDTAFELCSALTTVTIGSGVTSIGSHVFQMCPSLVEIIVSPENAAYCSVDGILFSKDMTSIVKYPPTKTGDYVIPNSVTTIENVAFYGCKSLTSVTLPDGLISIGTANFSQCTSLTEMIIPNSVTTIGSASFSGCSGLTTLTIGSGVTYIGSDAFYVCNAVEDVYITADPEALTWNEADCDKQIIIIGE